MTFENEKRIHTVLLFGGVGLERRVSEAGAYNLLSVAERVGIPLLPIGIPKDGGCFLYTGPEEKIKDGSWILTDSAREGYFRRGDDYAAFVTDDGEYRISGIIPLLHGDMGEDGSPQGFFEMLGIPYLGSATLGGALSTDKISTKLYAEAASVPTLPFVSYVARRGRACNSRFAYSPEEAVKKAVRTIGFPLFVKPSGLGSSIGGGEAYCEDSLYSAIERAAGYSDRVLIEKCLNPKRELECAFLDLGGKRLITPPGEVISRGFYDYEKKYGGETELVISAQIPERIKNQAVEYASVLAELLGIRHIGRIDFFLSEDGLYFNEINPIPGMTEGSLYLKLLSGAGVSEGEFLRGAVAALGGSL